MAENVNITIVGGQTLQVPKDSTALSFFKNNKVTDVPVMACILDGELRELTIQLSKDAEISPVGLNSEDGVRIYARTLRMVMFKAAQIVMPDSKIEILHSFSKGYYCEFKKNDFTRDKLRELAGKMQEIIRSDIPISKEKIPTTEAMKLYESSGFTDKAEILKYRQDEMSQVYKCGDTLGYFYGYMCPSTGYVPLFELRYYPPGFVLRYPAKKNPFKLPHYVKQPKLSALFREYEKWCVILGIKSMYSLNETIVKKELPEIIRVAEALHEKKISQIADLISMNKDLSVVFIAGPTSSGKTTFAQRLMVQLRVNGISPLAISLDDYFLDRERTPMDEFGNYDFDTIDALDLDLFHSDLLRLLNGEGINLPSYNFHTGKREYRGKKLKIERRQILLIEGIHGLNEKLSNTVERNRKFKIYVSALMQLNLDVLTPISTTDTRLIRRIVRDFHFRGTDAAATLQRWPLVRRGEEKNIFPFQEEADAMFNTSLVYELAVLKSYVEPLLQKVPLKTPEFVEARRLLKILQYIKTYDEPEDIPSNSILKEFIGESCFYNK